MRVVLCATDDTIAHLWKKNLKQTSYKRKIVEDENSLMSYLLKYKESKILVCIEDIWVGNSFDDIKELIVALKGLYEDIYIMVLSRYPSFSTGRAILALGVNGYGNSKMLPIHLQDAMECIANGNIWVYPEFVQMMIKSINVSYSKDSNNNLTLDNLSPREKEITKLIYEGYNNKEIAAMTNITLRTVKAHTTSIYEKMNVKDRVALVLLLQKS